MHSFVVYSLLACATLSVALDPRFEFPDTVPLVKRQQPGTPQYACHEDCGLLITLAREKDFCENDEWNERYNRCMECANTYGIWKYYGEGVEKAAEQCDLSPSPSPSGAGAVSTAVSAAVSTAVKTPTSTAEEPESTAVDTSTNAPEVSETATTAVTPSEVAPVVVTSAEDTPEQTEVTTPTPTPSAVATNSASRQYGFPTFIGLVAWTIVSLW